ncbi:hypothetical protein [Luedemannella helvata]|uniref:hypothetical protein n=1 Tax=Luedemannella helvata TaxID=349315 RepID=UPI0031D80DDF
MSSDATTLLTDSINASGRAAVFFSKDAPTSKAAFQQAKRLCKELFPVRAAGRVTFYDDGGTIKLLGGALLIFVPKPANLSDFDVYFYEADLGSAAASFTEVTYNDWPDT